MRQTYMQRAADKRCIVVFHSWEVSMMERKGEERDEWQRRLDLIVRLR